MRIGERDIVLVRGKIALAQIQGRGGADILIINQKDAGPRPCLVLDVSLLRKTGTFALDLDDAGRVIVTMASQLKGRRPWNDAAPQIITPLDE